MPKIIPELYEKIVETAEKLYTNNSFEEIDMRKIANLCGIAVGTLYNYFPNKEELFTKILEEAWNKKIDKLREISGSHGTSPQKLEQVLSMVYRFIVRYKGIGKDCFNRELYVREKDKMLLMKKVFNNIICRISEILYGLMDSISKERGSQISQGNLKRLSITVLFSLPGMVSFFPDEEKESIRFIMKTILSAIHEAEKNNELEEGL